MALALSVNLKLIIREQKEGMHHIMRKKRALICGKEYFKNHLYN